MEKCKICGEEIEMIDYNKNYKLLKCKSCGFLFKPDVKINYENLGESDYEVYNFNRSKEVEDIIKIIRKYFKDLDNVYLIEIGSGTGVLLSYFKSYGITIDGYEPSMVACNIAKREFNIDLKNQYFRGDKLNKAPQVILLYDVVEHLDDLNDLFYEIKKNMNDETILIIKSGNPNSINARLFLIKWSYVKILQHISFYPKRALDLVCENTGLKLKHYYYFKDAYGRFALLSLIKNLIRAGLNLLVKNEKYKNRFNIQLANDHFIAVIKKN